MLVVSGCYRVVCGCISLELARYGFSYGVVLERYGCIHVKRRHLGLPTNQVVHSRVIQKRFVRYGRN